MSDSNYRPDRRFRDDTFNDIRLPHQVQQPLTYRVGDKNYTIQELITKAEAFEYLKNTPSFVERLAATMFVNLNKHSCGVVTEPTFLKEYFPDIKDHFGQTALIWAVEQVFRLHMPEIVAQVEAHQAERNP